MSKRLHREFYLLPRGEQRALVLLSLLLIISLLLRLVAGMIPERVPAGMEDFEQEARAIMAGIARADSVQHAREDSIRVMGSGNSGRSTSRTNQRKSGKSVFPIDMNRADSVQLLPLPGIGPVFAGRIVKYRDLLGGFAEKEQLREVYGLSEETIKLIVPLIILDTGAIRKIHLDSAGFSELLRHPYLEYEDVKALEEYRRFKGNINSLSELQENHILSDSTMDLIGIYFDIR